MQTWNEILNAAQWSSVVTRCGIRRLITTTGFGTLDARSLRSVYLQELPSQYVGVYLEFVTVFAARRFSRCHGKKVYYCPVMVAPSWLPHHGCRIFTLLPVYEDRCNCLFVCLFSYFVVFSSHHTNDSSSFMYFQRPTSHFADANKAWSIVDAFVDELSPRNLADN
jgi:hypothetical protein